MKKKLNNLEIDINDFFNFCLKKINLILLILLIPALLILYEIITSISYKSAKIKLIPLDVFSMASFNQYNNYVENFFIAASASDTEASFLSDNMNDNIENIGIYNITDQKLFEFYALYLRDLKKIKFNDVFSLNKSNNNISQFDFFLRNVDLINSDNLRSIELYIERIDNVKEWESFLIKLNFQASQYVSNKIKRDFEIGLSRHKLYIQNQIRNLDKLTEQITSQISNLNNYSIKYYEEKNNMQNNLLRISLKKKNLNDQNQTLIKLEDIFKNLVIFEDNFYPISVDYMNYKESSNINFKKIISFLLLAISLIITYYLLSNKREKVKKSFL